MECMAYVTEPALGGLLHGASLAGAKTMLQQTHSSHGIYLEPSQAAVGDCISPSPPSSWPVP